MVHCRVGRGGDFLRRGCLQLVIGTGQVLRGTTRTLPEVTSDLIAESLSQLLISWPIIVDFPVQAADEVTNIAVVCSDTLPNVSPTMTMWCSMQEDRQIPIDRSPSRTFEFFTNFGINESYSPKKQNKKKNENYNKITSIYIEKYSTPFTRFEIAASNKRANAGFLNKSYVQFFFHFHIQPKLSQEDFFFLILRVDLSKYPTIFFYSINSHIFR